MRSFLEFVSRCLTTPEVSRNEEVVAAEATTPRRAETRALMPPTVVALRKKKRVIRVGTPGSTTLEWQPSLYVISEDNAMAEKREKTGAEAKPAADRALKRKSTSGSRSKVHVRSYSDDIGRNQVQMAIPTFSPAPFMF